MLPGSPTRPESERVSAVVITIELSKRFLPGSKRAAFLSILSGLPLLAILYNSVLPSLRKS